MRSCPACQRELSDERFKYGNRRCRDCLRAIGRAADNALRRRDPDAHNARKRAEKQRRKDGLAPPRPVVDPTADRLCPECGRTLAPDAFREGRRPCIECLQAVARERMRLRYQRDPERIRAANRRWVPTEEQRQRQRDTNRVRSEAKRRAAGIPVKRKGLDPVRRAETVRRYDELNRERRRVPDDQRKYRRPYATEEERLVGEAAERRRRNEMRRSPAGDKERAAGAERSRRIRKLNLEAVRAYERAAGKRWRLANPEAARRKGRLDASKRNALKRNADVRLVTDRDLERQRLRQRDQCAYCPEPHPETLDHIIPLVRGGRHSIGNLVWACAPCNKSKNARYVMEWRLGRRHPNARSRKRVAA